MKLTEKQENILNILKEKFADGAFAEEVITETEGLTIASVRATLSSLATKGLASKEKAEFDGKMKTKFTAIVTEQFDGISITDYISPRPLQASLV